MNWWARPSEWNRTAAGPAASKIAPHQHRYFAFLSYSHKDEAVVDWLHSALERFRVPASISGKLTENGVVPKRLTPIFRDRHELAAAADLGAEIRQALAASRFLIVLCSPAAAQSKWTNAEIDAFKRARPDGCVIAAIVGGEPFAGDSPGREGEECFPPALRHRYDRRGRPTAKRAEPLAADLRDDRDGRRMGLLKIVAAMLGVGLDDLVQRDHLRRQRRLAAIAAASLAGMLVTSGLAVFALDARNTATEQRRQAEGLVGFMLGDLRDKLEPLGRLDVLDSVGSRALEYYQKQDKSKLSDAALAQRSKALTLMGEVANTRGDLNAALSRYQEALASTAETVRRYPDDPQRLFDHAQNVYWVGYIAYQRGQVSEASNRFNEYRRLANRMVALDPGNKDYRLEEVYANSNLGTLLMEERRYAQAALAFQSSLRPAESLAAAEPNNVDYQKQVSGSLAWLADAHEYAGELDQALAERERQLRILDSVGHLDPIDQRDAMAAHFAIGRLLASRGQAMAGLKEMQAGVADSEALYRIEPDNTEWLQASATGRFQLADLQLAMGRTDEAARTTRGACDIVSRLLQRDRSVANWRAKLQVACLNLRGRLAIRSGNAAQALTLARQSLAAAQSNPKHLERSLLSFAALANGGNLLAQAGNRSEAVRWWRAAVRTIPPSAQLQPGEKAELASVQLGLGNLAATQRLTADVDAIGYSYPRFTRAAPRTVQ
ncbi:MAG: toll/interleukin-1 receptor domain-containing protein [Pseudomonadota bacterium]|nr:toll/interleukin-1 receptor domain-containing protein [Sphingomonas sp.]MDQ3478467.1 toll/interleukin-1 receptor domain-containing protein [Pseudomonadota bacterium]